MKPSTPPLKSTRLLDQVRERIRYLHYSLSTEQTYLYWVRFFIRWSGQGGAMRHPRDIGPTGVEAFLTMLATERKVSASTHNQALSALLFLYREVLTIDVPWLNDINRPNQKRRIPSVLTKDEVAGLLANMDGQPALLAQLLYGTGMRLMEAMRLRIKDVDFDRRVIIVREAKGGKDRVVMLPQSLAPALRLQMLAARAQWEADHKAQRGGVETPHALEQKNPQVGNTLAWFWMFPSPTPSEAEPPSLFIPTPSAPCASPRPVRVCEQKDQSGCGPSKHLPVGSAPSQLLWGGCRYKTGWPPRRQTPFGLLRRRKPCRYPRPCRSWPGQ
jgi:integron integrase